MSVLAAVINLNGHQDYVHAGWLLVSVANLVVIGLMVLVFAVALFLPFPGRRARRRE